jgi:hypothetical protein
VLASWWIGIALEAVFGMKASLKYVIHMFCPPYHKESGKLKSIVPGLQSVVPLALGDVADIMVSHADRI